MTHSKYSVPPNFPSKKSYFSRYVRVPQHPRGAENCLSPSRKSKQDLIEKRPPVFFFHTNLSLTEGRTFLFEIVSLKPCTKSISQSLKCLTNIGFHPPSSPKLLKPQPPWPLLNQPKNRDAGKWYTKG